jgi:hypothetical protein
MMTMATLDCLLERGERVALIETDTSNHDVWNAYQELVPSGLFGLDRADGWIDFMNTCDSSRPCPTPGCTSSATATSATPGQFELYNRSKLRERIERRGGKSLLLPDLEHVTHQFSGGHRFLDDLPREPLADDRELEAATGNRSASEEAP